MPSALITTVPWVLAPVATPVTLRMSPSGSVSLASTVTVTGVSSAVVLVSFTATGGSFTGVTVMFTVAVDVPPWPSLIV